MLWHNEQLTMSQTNCNDCNYRRYQLKKTFDAPFDWTESQVKSPALLKLRDSLKVNLGGVSVFTCPYGAGKSFVLRDLTVLMRRNHTFVMYIDGRSSAGFESATDFVYTSLGLTKEAARENLGPLLPVSTGENKTTIIIDHFEDLMHLFDAEVLIRSLARETYEKPDFRVLVCVAPESRVLKVVEWNGRVKIRLAIWPLSARWPRDLILSLLHSVSDENREELVECAVRCGMPGRVPELALSSSAVRDSMAALTEMAWREMETKLRPIALSQGFYSRELDSDLTLTML